MAAPDPDRAWEGVASAQGRRKGRGGGGGGGSPGLHPTHRIGEAPSPRHRAVNPHLPALGPASAAPCRCRQWSTRDTQWASSRLHETRNLSPRALGHDGSHPAVGTRLEPSQQLQKKSSLLGLSFCQGQRWMGPMGEGGWAHRGEHPSSAGGWQEHTTVTREILGDCTLVQLDAFPIVENHRLINSQSHTESQTG